MIRIAEREYRGDFTARHRLDAVAHLVTRRGYRPPMLDGHNRRPVGECCSVVHGEAIAVVMVSAVMSADTAASAGSMDILKPAAA